MKKFLLIILLCVLPWCNICSQQIAKADAINSLDFILRQTTMANPAEDIYDDIWNNSSVNCYNSKSAIHGYSIKLSDFHMPIMSHKIIVTSNYGYRKQFRRYHRGIDLDLHKGDTIYATFSGKIRMSKYEAKGYGNYVVIRHFNGLETIYGHMSKRLVHENEYVYAGQPIGLGGSTGRSTGAHLHLEIWFCGVSINPKNIFNFEYQDVTDDYYIFK